MVSRLEAEHCINEAVKLIKKFTSENREATIEEQAQLVAMGTFLAGGIIECMFRIADALEAVVPKPIPKPEINPHEPGGARSKFNANMTPKEP